MFVQLFKKSTRTKERRSFRSAEVQAQYDSSMRMHNAVSDCALCDGDRKRKAIEELQTIRVIENDFPYMVFEDLPVESHLLIITRRHVSDLGKLTGQEAEEYWDAISRYNSRGYSVLTRAATKSTRSIPDHVHSHLILCR